MALHVKFTSTGSTFHPGTQYDSGLNNLYPKVNFLANISDFVRNARIVRNTIEYSSVLPDYLQSCQPAKENQALFDAVHTYVMFVGIGRSGTTLIGSLLDAHPQIIIANQQSTLKYLQPRLFTREQIYYLLLRNSQNAALCKRMGGGGYSYAVPNQWQGRFEKLEVIGDKSKSAQAVSWLISSPKLLQNLAQLTQARIRMIHVIRNPYDTIATRSIRRHLSLEKICREYFAISQKLQSLISTIETHSEYDVQRIPVYLEDFIGHPETHLATICNSLGVEVDSSYLLNCAQIVQPPHKSRNDVSWDKKLKTEIRENLEKFSFLQGYSFDD